jgi:hypothetical protein
MGYFRLAKGVVPHRRGIGGDTVTRETMETGEVLYAPERNVWRSSAL